MHTPLPRHFDPLRPHRILDIPEQYEFAHGEASICVYDINTLDFIKEIPVGPRPDCHSTSLDNHYLYIACQDGLHCIDQESLTVANVVDTGHVFATNVLPDGDTMLLHDAYGGVFVLKDIQNMDKIHIHKHMDVLGTNTFCDTLGGKGHFIGNGRYYICCAWQHPKVYIIDLEDDYSVDTFIENDPALQMGDDLVINKDKTKAYAACYNGRDNCYVSVINLSERRVIKEIPTGHGTCGMTMSNNERYVIASNDADDAISVIDTETDEPARNISARAGFEKLGISSYIQGISIGRQDEVYVYGCSGSGALVVFDGPESCGWSITYPKGKITSSDLA